MFSASARVALSEPPEEVVGAMKMLFLSSDSSRVEQTSRALTSAGIPCEIRKAPSAKASFDRPPQAELWIKEDSDCHKALMLCLKLGVGFVQSTAVGA